MMRFTGAIFTLMAYCIVTCSSAIQRNENQSIAELVIATPELSTLLDIVLAHNDYLKLLSDCRAGPFTVFAPTDKYFKKTEKTVMLVLDAVKETEPDMVPKALTEYLGYVLGFHVLKGEVRQSDMKDGQQIETLNEESITVSVDEKEVIRIAPAYRDSGAKVVEEFEACNGIVHIVKSVLNPPVQVLAPAQAPVNDYNTNSGD